MGTIDLPPLSDVVSAPRITIREKIRIILDKLRQTRSVTFEAMLDGQCNRLDIVVTFLAMLELIKRHLVEAQQDSLFSDIQLAPLGEWDESQDAEIEFE